MAITSQHVTGKDLTRLPIYNGTSTNDASPVVKAIVKNIRSRRSFTNGKDFVTSVFNTIENKFPSMTRVAVRLNVYRALDKYFA